MERRRLPPLAMLRAFEAAARHGNLSRAAGELSVTHGAVSRQVRALEDHLGRRLLKRTSRGVVPTEAGRRLAHGLREGFERMAAAVTDARAERAGPVVRLHTLPSFAAQWLVPRLPKLRARGPDIDLEVRTSLALVDLRREGVDLAVRYGAGSWPGLTAEELLRPESFPVAAPGLLARHGPLRRPRDLAGVPLLHDQARDWWADWFAAAGVAAPASGPDLVFDDYNVVIQAAREGHGVALASDALLEGDIAAGRLVRLFEASVTPPLAYYLVRPAGTRPSAEAEAVMAWLRANAAGPPAQNR